MTVDLACPSGALAHRPSVPARKTVHTHCHVRSLANAARQDFSSFKLAATKFHLLDMSYSLTEPDNRWLHPSRAGP